MDRLRARLAATATLMVTLLAVLGAAGRVVQNTTTNSDAAFQRAWERVDAPVADGATQRTWIWGPTPLAPDVSEPYLESPGGQRSVRYYDKSRMEITHPDTDPGAAWYVTNGLLVRELVSGARQVGDATFEPHTPASINVVGDPDDPRSPTYAGLATLLAAPARSDGSVIVERVQADGTVTTDPALASEGVQSAYRVTVPGLDHQVASVFWKFMNSTGPLQVDGTVTDGSLFESPFYATGYPITEAYWTTVLVGGVERLVLLQAFERRVLSYTPDNPLGWRVESGNVGQHYFRWLQDTAPPPPTAPTPTTPPPASAALVTVGPGAVDDWTRSIVRDSHDRIWIIAANNNPAYTGSGPAELRIYQANQAGIPTAFEEVAAVSILATDGGTIPFADAALDGNDLLHVAWLDHGAPGQPVLYRVFDLTAEAWLGAAEVIDSTNLAGYGGLAGQGGLSIALDSAGTPRVAYCAADNQTQIRVRARQGAGWSEPAQPLAVAGAYVWHPALAVGPGNDWTLAAYDATHDTILASTDAGSGWSAAQLVATGVLGPESIDQGPALLVSSGGAPTLTYLDGASNLRISQRLDGAWGDVPLGGDYVTHAPGLGGFADGTLIVAGHDPASPPTGLDALRGRPGSWGAWQPLLTLHADGSEVFRWAGNFSPASDTYVDLLFFDEDTNDDGTLDDETLYYSAVPTS